MNCARSPAEAGLRACDGSSRDWLPRPHGVHRGEGPDQSVGTCALPLGQRGRVNWTAVVTGLSNEVGTTFGRARDCFVGFSLVESATREAPRPEALAFRLVSYAFSGADDGIRTRDPHLGKAIRHVLSLPGRYCSVRFRRSARQTGTEPDGPGGVRTERLSPRVSPRRYFRRRAAFTSPSGMTHPTRPAMFPAMARAVPDSTG